MVVQNMMYTFIITTYNNNAGHDFISYRYVYRSYRVLSISIAFYIIIIITLATRTASAPITLAVLYWIITALYVLYYDDHRIHFDGTCVMHPRATPTNALLDALLRVLYVYIEIKQYLPNRIALECTSAVSFV